MNKVIIIVLLLSSFVMHGQSIPRKEVSMDELMALLSPLVVDDLNYEEIYENIYVLYQNPLDINRADRSELSSLFFLSERQINDILNHRLKFGNFLSLYELQSLESLSLEDIQMLLPFVFIRDTLGDLSLKGLLKRATEHYLVLRADQTLEKSKGYINDKYLGSRQRYYTRYRWSRSKDFSIGFTSEKDQGEKDFLDYMAFHLQIQNKGKLKNLVVGDYLMQFGQGMIFSAGYVAGKGGEPVYTTRRNNLGARPYSSLIENGSFRGVSGTYLLGKIEVTGMASYKKRDASVSDDSSETSEQYFSSLLSAGMHRTENELKNKNAVTETNLGANILYKIDHLQLGFSILNTHFDKVFEKRNLAYNYYDFTGKENTIMGPNIAISVQNFNIFAEAARSSSGGYGYLIGVVGSLGKQVEIALNHRNYQPDFHTLYGNAFSESSRTINERGVYVGVKYIIKKGLDVVGYYDSFRFPWLKYRVDAPSTGYDYQLRINYKPTKKFSSFLAYKGEEKQRNPSSSKQVIRELEDTQRRAVVINGDYSPNMFIKFQSRIQYNAFEQSSLSNGWAFIQDIEGRINRIQIKTRVAYFKTDSFDSRIYAYENDVLYSVSFPAYYGTGFRFYAITKVPITRNLEAWLRIAQTRVSDRETMGSGNDEIPKNHKTDVRVQLKYKF